MSSCSITGMNTMMSSISNMMPPYDGNTLTSKKYQALNEKYPEFLPVYASEEDVRKLAPEDQKLFAEVVYSWLINRIDNMDTAYDLDYLFCVLTDEPYDEQFILFIAAGDGARRGNEPGDIYPIGKILKASAEQQEAIRKAAEGEPQSVLNKDGRYIDYFYPLSVTNNHLLLIGVTHDVKVIKETIFHQTLSQSWLSVLYLIDLMIVCLVMIYYAVLRPLEKIQENIRLYKDTKNSKRSSKTSPRSDPTTNWVCFQTMSLIWLKRSMIISTRSKRSLPKGSASIQSSSWPATSRTPCCRTNSRLIPRAKNSISLLQWIRPGRSAVTSIISS